MKIISFFADQIYVFQYEGNEHDEFERNLNLWNDIEYLKGFFDENKEHIAGNTFLKIDGIRDFYRSCK